MHPFEIAIQVSGMIPDTAQSAAIASMCRIYDQIVQTDHRLLNFWRRLWHRPASSRPLGIYLWGDVGRGKTHLCDVFYETLPVASKRRRHFHRFMRDVHQSLARYKNVRDPLQTLTAQLAQEIKVLCLDEMQVTDITDAMLIHGLLRGLFDRGVILITTANTPPHELYKNGLQRQRFLPAIDLLQRHTQVIHLSGVIDYRLRALEQAEIYHTPLDAAADVCLADNFHRIVAVDKPANEALLINDREIPTVKWAEDVVWFEFAELCDAPRSKEDYLEIARLFHTVLIANIPSMSAAEDDAARRFINMIDEFYDRNVKVIISAATPVEELYRGQRLAFEFKRTISRLKEMQSHDYLAQPHLG